VAQAPSASAPTLNANPRLPIPRPSIIAPSLPLTPTCDSNKRQFGLSWQKLRSVHGRIAALLALM
jgi:hypothetical protein